jgi:hypothetical protein
MKNTAYGIVFERIGLTSFHSNNNNSNSNHLQICIDEVVTPSAI